MGLITDVRDTIEAVQLVREALSTKSAPPDSTDLSTSAEDIPLGFYLAGNGALQAVGKAFSGEALYSAYAMGIPMRELRQDKMGYAFAYVQSEYTFRAVNAISDDMAGIPAPVVNKRTGEPNPDHPLSLAIRDASKQYGQNLIAMWVKGLMIFGESYVEPTRSFFGKYVGSRWLNPLGVDLVILGDSITSIDATSRSGKISIFKPNELVYDKIPSIFDDLRGQSLLGVALNSVNIDRDVVRYTKSFFLNDMRPGGILTARQGVQLTSPQIKQTLEELKKQIKGVGRRHAPIVLPSALEWQQIEQGITTEQFEVEESVRRRICMALNIPISTAGAWDDARYQSAPEQRKAYYEGTITRGWERLATVINDRMMPFYDTSGEYELRPDLTKIQALVEDIKQKAEIMDSRLEAGTITINQHRAAFNDPPIEGGDVLVFKSGTVLVPLDQLDRANEMLAGAITPATQINFANGQTPALPANTAPPMLPGGKALSVVLSAPENPDLIGLQNRMRDQFKGADVQWRSAADFSITLADAPSVTQDQADALKGALTQLNLPQLALGLGSMRTFDRLGDFAVHLRVRRNTDLLDLQESVYDVMQREGIGVSSHSRPEQFTPHFTVAYAKQRPPAVMFNSNLNVKPKELVVYYDGKAIYRRALSQTALALPSATTTALDILHRKMEEAGVQVNVNIQPQWRNDKASSTGTPEAYAILCLYNDAGITVLQDRLKDMFPNDDRVRWAQPGAFHITLFYAELISDDQLRSVIDKTKAPPPMRLKAGPVSTFDTSYDGKVLILPVEPTDELKAYQQEMLARLEKQGVPVSEYSTAWKPHITLAYIGEGIEVPPDLPDVLTVVPQSVDFSRGEYVSITRLPILKQTSADEELKAWENSVNKSHNPNKPLRFECYFVPDTVADFIRTGLAQPEHDTKALFTQARAKLGYTKSIDQYRSGIRSAIRGYWRSDLNRADFLDTGQSVMDRRLAQAFYEGARTNGFVPDDLSDDELERMYSEISSEHSHLVAFARDIENSDRTNGGALQPLFDRAEAWITKYDDMFQLGRTLTGADKKYKWNCTFKDGSCEDCKMLHGRVYRGSTWATNDVRPKSRRLKCFGTHCDCGLEETDEPITRGRFPSLIGPG